MTKYGGLLAAGVLSTGMLTSSPASAEQNPTSAACTISVGSVTAGGDHRMQTFAMTSPVSRITDKIVAKDIYPDGQVRLSSAIRYGDNEVGAEDHIGPVVMGSVLYDTRYLTPYGGGTATEKQITRVGPGWQVYRTLDRSTFVTPTRLRETEYSLRDDGTVERRTVGYDDGRAYRRVDGWKSGFRGVKAMTLISQTAEYDTFLMTLTSGKLYTARFPLSGGHIIPTVVKQVRGSTWQVFETLVAARCGRQSTLLLGIDKDTGSGYLYAVGHANGLSTPIQSLGRVPGTFTDPVHFRWVNFTDPPLFGE